MADTWFNGDHGPEGAWKSLKGPMLAPHTQQPSVQDKNMGPERLNQQVSGCGSWNSNVVVSTGLTGPGGTLAK